MTSLSGIFSGYVRRLDRGTGSSLCVVFLGFFLGLVWVVVGCGRGKVPIRVGTNIWPGYEPLYLAQSLGYYDGGRIQLVEFPSATEVVRAYRNRAIEVAALTLDEAISMAETLPDQRVMLVCDFSNGADVIVARPGFRSMLELRGRRIGLESGALGAYVLMRGLALAGMEAREVTPVPLPLEDHESAYGRGLVDAVVTFEPHRSKLLGLGGRVVFDSSRIPREIVDVLVVRPEVAGSATESLGELGRGWFRALGYLREHPGDSAVRLAPRERVSPEVFRSLLSGIEFPSRQENLVMLDGAHPLLAGSLETLSRLMLSQKLITRTNHPVLRLDPDLVRKGTP